MTAWRRVVNSGAGVGAGAGGKLARVQVETPADTTTTGPGTHQPARTISSVKVTYSNQTSQVSFMEFIQLKS